MLVGSPFIQNSIVPLVSWRLLLIGTFIEPVAPSKVKAWPTSPVPYVTPPEIAPRFTPAESVVSPSPRYQATALAGTAVQFALPAVSVIAAVV